MIAPILPTAADPIRPWPFIEASDQLIHAVPWEGSPKMCLWFMVLFVHSHDRRGGCGFGIHFSYN